MTISYSKVLESSYFLNVVDDVNMYIYGIWYLYQEQE